MNGLKNINEIARFEQLSCSMFWGRIYLICPNNPFIPHAAIAEMRDLPSMATRWLKHFFWRYFALIREILHCASHPVGSVQNDNGGWDLS